MRNSIAAALRASAKTKKRVNSSMRYPPGTTTTTQVEPAAGVEAFFRHTRAFTDTKVVMEEVIEEGSSLSAASLPNGILSSHSWISVPTCSGKLRSIDIWRV